MQIENCSEWDFIQNSIKDLTNKLELLPIDLKNKAVELLQEKLSYNKITSNDVKKKRNSGRIIKQTIKAAEFIYDDTDENQYLEEPNKDEDFLIKNIKHEMIENDKFPMVEHYKNEVNENDENNEYTNFNSSNVLEISEFLCETCAFVGSSPSEINKHKRCSHGVVFERICHTCGKVLPNFRQLQSHIAGHLEEKKLSDVERRKLKFTCEICGTKLRSKWIYMEHIGRHFNRQIKTCDICGKRFPNSSQLNAHKHAHEPPKIPCFICNKKFRNKHKLFTHQLIHSGQRDFLCPECPYTSYVKHNLQKHCLNRHNLKYPPVRKSIKRFHPDDFETSMLNDPVARSYISKIRDKGECFPIDDKSDLKDVLLGCDLTNPIDSSELAISNEVEIKENTKKRRKNKKDIAVIDCKTKKIKKERSVRAKKKKIVVDEVKENWTKDEEKYILTSNTDEDNSFLSLYGYNIKQGDYDHAYNAVAYQLHAETTIDCVEETIYA